MRNYLFLIAVVLGSITFFSACHSNKTNDVKSNDSVTVLYYEFHDFESLSGPLVDSTKGSSGKKSGALNQKTEYSFGLIKHFRDLSSFKNIEEVNVSFKCWMNQKYSEPTFVLSIDDSLSGKNILWEGKPLVTTKINDWDQIKINFKINKKFIKPEYLIKLYIWNRGKNTFYFDDLSFTFVQKK